MTDKEMIKYLESKGYKITKSEIVNYDIEVSFNGFIGTTSVVKIQAPKDSKEDYLKELLLTEYKYELFDLLEVEDVNSSDEDEWEVCFSFDGYIGTETYYEVDGDDEDDAVDNALEEALDDFDIVSFEIK